MDNSLENHYTENEHPELLKRLKKMKYSRITIPNASEIQQRLDMLNKDTPPNSDSESDEDNITDKTLEELMDIIKKNVNELKCKQPFYKSKSNAKPHYFFNKFADDIKLNDSNDNESNEDHEPDDNDNEPDDNLMHMD